MCITTVINYRSIESLCGSHRLLDTLYSDRVDRILGLGGNGLDLQVITLVGLLTAVHTPVLRGDTQPALFVWPFYCCCRTAETS